MIRIGLLGSRGRMGSLITKLLDSEYSEQAILAASVDRGDPATDLLNTDVVIDFSGPGALSSLLKTLESSPHSPAILTGTTGLTKQQLNELETASAKTLVLASANFSVGVTALIHLLRQFSPTLLQLGYTPVVTETHHRHKKDAPSGTALALCRAIATDQPDKVQTHSIRAGEIVGDHEVAFFGPADTLTITHHAMDRSIFARGAIDVALWLAKRRKAAPNETGLMTMESYLNSI